MEMPEPGEFVFDPELGEEVTTVPLDAVRHWSDSPDVCEHCAYLRTTLCVERSCIDVVYLTKTDYLDKKIQDLL